jgi:hypothetical protein
MIMASPLISKFRFWSHTLEEINVPREWLSSFIEIVVDIEDWRGLRLFLQGKPIRLRLENHNGRDQILADWERSGPGNYELRLFHHEEEIDHKAVRISPRKISNESFAALLEELENTLPSAVAIGLNKTEGLTGISIKDARKGNVGHELTRLRRAVYGVPNLRPGLAEILEELASSPHQRLSTEPIWVRLDQARRPVLSQLYRAIASPSNIAQNGLPKKIVDGRVEHTVDVYENRLVKLFWFQVNRRLHQLRGRFQARGSQKQLEEVEDLLGILVRGRRSAKFLDEVQLPSTPPTNLTMVLLKRAPYRAALEGLLEFIKSQTVTLDLPELGAPLENLPKLYEIWGTLKVIEAVLIIGERKGYKTIRHQLVQRSAGDLFVRVFSNGKPAVVLRHTNGNRTVSVRPQHSIGHSGPLRSISFDQIPDILIEIASEDGKCDVILFDPKYKLNSENMIAADKVQDGGPKKDDIDKMHAYRDAIRDSHMRRIVRYAAILYPGQKNFEYQGEVAALSSIPGNSKSMDQALGEVLDRFM